MHTLLNFVLELVGSLTHYVSHPLGWALLLVAGYMGLQQWTWWAPATAGFMAALILIDEITVRMSFDAVFGSSTFYRVLLLMVIISYLGYAAGRLVARAR
jgi:hypothetical protein